MTPEEFYRAKQGSSVGNSEGVPMWSWSPARPAIVFVLFATVMNVSGLGWLNWYLLCTDGRATSADVTQWSSQHRGVCRFTYDVRGRTYERSETGCRRVTVGASVTATYAGSMPSMATLKDPGTEFAGELGAALFVAAITGLNPANKRQRLDPAKRMPLS